MRGKTAAPVTPVSPMLVHLMLVQRTLAQPTLVQPTLVQPTLVQPTLVQPTLVQPTLVQPTLVQPTLVQPTLVRRRMVGLRPTEASLMGGKSTVVQTEGLVSMVERTPVSFACAQPLQAVSFLLCLGPFRWLRATSRQMDWLISLSPITSTEA